MPCFLSARTAKRDSTRPHTLVHEGRGEGATVVHTTHSHMYTRHHVWEAIPVARSCFCFSAFCVCAGAGLRPPSGKPPTSHVSKSSISATQLFPMSGESEGLENGQALKRGEEGEATLTSRWDLCLNFRGGKVLLLAVCCCFCFTMDTHCLRVFSFS